MKVNHAAKLESYITYTMGRPCYSPHHAARLRAKVTSAWMSGKISGEQSLNLKALIA